MGAHNGATGIGAQRNTRATRHFTQWRPLSGRSEVSGLAAVISTKSRRLGKCVLVAGCSDRQ